MGTLDGLKSLTYFSCQFQYMDAHEINYRLN